MQPPAFTKALLPLLARAGASLLIAALVVAGVSAAARVAPPDAIRALLGGAFGSPAAWELTLKRMVPILLTGLSVGWAFRAGLFNIGAEGQLLWGALAAAWVGFAFKLPAVLHLPLALLAGALAGALWALPAGLLKVTRRVPEVVSTLLLSFLAIELTRLMANGPLHDPTRQGPRTPDIQPTAVLPMIAGHSLHGGLLLALLAALALALVLGQSRFGFQLRMVGRGPEAARASSVSVSRVWLLALVQSGALAGLAGAVEVLGVHRYFQAGFSPGYGYEGIAVAILGGSAPLGTILSALFWGALANGAVELELSTGLSRHVVSIIQALVILAVAVRRWPIPAGLGPRAAARRKRHPVPEMQTAVPGLTRLLLFIVVAVLVATALHAGSPLVVDRDALYHYRHAALYAERGPFFGEFPWAAYSVISREGSDLWYGFHLLLAPVTRLTGPIAGLEVASIFVLALSLVLLYAALRRLEVGWPEAWPFLLLFCAPPAVLRMLALRPQVLSLGLLALLFALLVRGRARHVLVAAAVLAWVHLNLAWVGLAVAVLFVAARSVLERRLLWRPLAAVLGGLVLGWVLRPHPLGAARLLWTQLVLLAQTRAEGVPLLWGGEVSPRPPHEAFTLFWSLLVLLLAAAIAWAIQRRRPRPIDAPDRAALLCGGGLAVLAGVLTFTHAARWSDLWKLFAVLFAALALDRWILRQPQDGAHPAAGRHRWYALLGLLVLQCGMLLQLALPPGRRMWTSGFDPERLRPHAQWLAGHSTPGDIVFHARWEVFAELFFWNTRNRYINGMDPIFLYARSTALYWEMHHLASGASRLTFAGQEPNQLGVDSTLSVLRRDFKARYLLVEADQRDLLYYARHEPRLKLVFEDEAASLFLLRE